MPGKRAARLSSRVFPVLMESKPDPRNKTDKVTRRLEKMLIEKSAIGDNPQGSNPVPKRLHSAGVLAAFAGFLSGFFQLS